MVEERERETVIQTKREIKKDTEKKKERECGQKWKENSQRPMQGIKIQTFQENEG